MRVSSSHLLMLAAGCHCWLVQQCRGVLVRSTRSSGRDVALVAFTLFATSVGTSRADESPLAHRVLVKVNGDPITSADLELACLSRGLPADVDSETRRLVLEQLIDERLMRAFLSGRRAEPNPIALEAQVERIHGLIRRQGGDPDEILGRLGFTDATLRETLALPLAWETHVLRILTEAQLKTYFEEHRRELDGTQVRARHILIKLPADADAAKDEQARVTLTQLRRQIEAGALNFGDAAKVSFQAPSASAGGDVGFFPHRGVMPVAFANAGFATSVGKVAGPVRTPAGLHLIEVTEEKPGQLSLEDVRDEVVALLSREWWETEVAAERAQATIVRVP